MFDEIFQRRNVIVEAQRTKPIDAHEVFHACKLIFDKHSKVISNSEI